MVFTPSAVPISATSAPRLANKPTVTTPGSFPLPVEVIPMARSAVARQLVKLGGRPEYRQGVVTDNGAMQINLSATEAMIFSRVSAAPPPLIICMWPLISSAP
jgi:hypothetical protein